MFDGRLSAYPRTAAHALRDFPTDGRATYEFTVVLANDMRAEGLRSEVTFQLSAVSTEKRIRAAFSAESTFAPQLVSPPVVSGVPAVGGVLTASPGVWLGRNLSFSYQWERCTSDSAGSCEAIASAGSPSYTVVGEDAGDVLLVRVVASNGGGSSAPVLSAPSAGVPPALVSPPVVSGVPAVGGVLTASPGVWLGRGLSFAYQWERCTSDSAGSCEAIASAGSASYTVVGEDAGDVLLVRVVASNGGGSSAPVLSAPSAGVPPALVSPPVVSGVPAVGGVLTASPGVWLGRGLSFAYQWERCDENGSSCVDISGATQRTFSPDRAVVHGSLVVAVSAEQTMNGDQRASASSSATGLIAPSVNPIVVENQKPGTTAWQISGGLSSSIEGYASQISVHPGDQLDMHVSANGNAPYRIELYRLGWYGGAGGRLMGCLPSCTGSEPGTQYPIPAPDPTTGELDAGWPVTDTATVGTDWVSGYYVAKLVLTAGSSAGQASYIFFIVKAPVGNTSAILVQASVNTWEAYNNWGGKSLYGFNSTDTVPATVVSFNRPFLSPSHNTTPFEWEYPLARYLEREGYDVTYQTEVDTDQNSSSLLGHKLDVVSGHSEYWSHAMRLAFDSARDDGVNLAFIGADIGYWQMRYADSTDRAIAEYRTASADPDPNPTYKTVPFSQLATPLPECQLLGIGTNGGFLQHDDPHAYTVQSAAAASPFFAGTGLSPGTVVPNVVGYEWSGIVPGCSVPAVQDLMHWEDSQNRPADAVAYQAPSGARVFSEGTLNLTWSLDSYGEPGWPEDSRVQTLFSNVFDQLGS